MRQVVIVGAGPAGLAAAIAAKQAGLDYLVLEKGVLVNSIYRFPPQMTFFTTPELLEIGGLAFVSPYEKPTRLEALRYYRRVAESHALEIAMGCEVTALRCCEGGFELLTRGSGAARALERARAVIVATGYYDHPNRLDIPGEELPHVSHYYGDPHVLYRQRVVIVGGKNSAAIAALEAYRSGAASVTLVHRRERFSDSIKYWIRPDLENRIKEGSIAARLQSRLVEIRAHDVTLEGPEGQARLEADVVLLLTGYRPDVELLRSAGVRIDDQTLKPLHDPETLETNVPGLYVVGSASAGRETNRIFIETGRFHGETALKALLTRLRA